MSSVSNLPNNTASATATHATAALIEEMKRAREAHTAQIQKLTALVATATTNNASNPATGGGGVRVHYNISSTRRVGYPRPPPPPERVKTTGAERKGNTIRTCSICT